MASVNNIERLRKARGWARPELARRMGTSPQQIEKLEKGQRRLAQDWIDRAAAALEVKPSDIISEDLVSLQSANAVPIMLEPGTGERMRGDLPIFGTALGAPRAIDGEAIEQTMLNQGEVVGYVKRPTILNQRPDAYALYVVGSSMSPVHPEGSMILAETKRPPSVGDDVVVYLRPSDEEDDGQRARAVLVKRLVRRTAAYVELEQFTPAISFRIEACEILRIDRVMTLGDLLT